MEISKIFTVHFTCCFAIIIISIAGILSAETDPANQCSDLIQALKKEDLPMVKSLIGEGADVNCRDNTGMIPLHAALEKNCSTALIETLLKSGADITMCDKDGASALHIAAGWGNLSNVKLVFEKGPALNPLDSNQETILHYAAINADTAIILYLLQHGGKAMVHAKDRNVCTALQYAVKKRWYRNTEDIVAIVRILADNGSEINTQDSSKETILHSGILRYSSIDDTFCVKLIGGLLKCGADPGICGASFRYLNSACFCFPFRDSPKGIDQPQFINPK